MVKSSYHIQETIEQKCRNETIHRFEKDLTDKVQSSEGAATYYGSLIMKRAIEPLVELIQRELDAAAIDKAGRNNTAMQCIAQFNVKVLVAPI